MSFESSKIDTGKYFPLYFQLDTEIFARRRLKVLWRESPVHRYLVVNDVLSGGIGARIGLREGDRLGMLDGKHLPSIRDLDKLTRNGGKNIQKNSSHRGVTLMILRKKSNEKFKTPALEQARKQETITEQNSIIPDCSYFRYDQPEIETDQEDREESETSESNQSSYETAQDWRTSNESQTEFSFYNEEKPENMPAKVLSQIFRLPRFHSGVIHINRQDKRNSDSEENPEEKYLINKENYPPVNLKPDPGDSLSVVLKKHEKISYSKLAPEPDFLVKQKIDQHVKQQRALRDIEQNTVVDHSRSFQNNLL